MKYQKPELVALTTAVKAIQTPTSKKLPPHDNIAARGTGPAYEADE
jgi:hypothetical protein